MTDVTEGRFGSGGAGAVADGHHLLAVPGDGHEVYSVASSCLLGLQFIVSYSYKASQSSCFLNIYVQLVFLYLRGNGQAGNGLTVFVPTTRYYHPPQTY